MSYQTVPCPACGLLCTLRPLDRIGSYRLVDADGGSHAPVCDALEPRSGINSTTYRRAEPLPAAPVPQTCQNGHDYARYGGPVLSDGRKCRRCRQLWRDRRRWLDEQRRAEHERVAA